LGFGGFCFPKDLQAFIHLAARVGVDFDILKAARAGYKQRIDKFFFDKVRQALWVIKGNASGAGTAFRRIPTTSDSRLRWRLSGNCCGKERKCRQVIGSDF